MQPPQEQEKEEPPLLPSELLKVESVVEIISCTAGAAAVALKKSHWNLEETITRLATDEQFLSQCVEQGAKMENTREQKKPEEVLPYY